MIRRSILLAIAGSSLSFSSHIDAQSLPIAPPEWMQQATEAENSRQYDRAIAIYRSELERSQNPLPVRIALGRALRLSGNVDEARKVFSGVLATNPQNVRAMLALAVIETQDKKLSAANEWIGKAVNAGALPLQLESPAELGILRETPEFKTHLELARRYANPCKYNAEYAAFDFWIGDWDVYVNGRLTARNIVTREMNGCIIHERYRTNDGAIRGESLNYYDPQEKRWEQTWVASGGNVIAYTGNSPRAGVMEMNGTSVVPGVDAVQLQRVVWEKTPDDGLTQSVSVSNDRGKTWGPSFSGRYVRSNRPIKGMFPDDVYPLNSALSTPSTEAQ